MNGTATTQKSVKQAPYDGWNGYVPDSRAQRRKEKDISSLSPKNLISQYSAILASIIKISWAYLALFIAIPALLRIIIILHLFAIQASRAGPHPSTIRGIQSAAILGDTETRYRVPVQSGNSQVYIL